MADYKDKLDDLHRAAKQKARELDEKLGVSGMVEDASRVAGDAARKGAKTIANGAEQLRHDPTTSDTVLIAITGYGTRDDRDRAVTSGFNHFYTKPADLDHLFGVLAHL